MLTGFAFYFNWKLGAGWTVVAILGFIVLEKLMLRTVDAARINRSNL